MRFREQCRLYGYQCNPRITHTPVMRRSTAKSLSDVVHPDFAVVSIRNRLYNDLGRSLFFLFFRLNFAEHLVQIIVADECKQICLIMKFCYVTKESGKPSLRSCAVRGVNFFSAPRIRMTTRIVKQTIPKLRRMNQE